MFNNSFYNSTNTFCRSWTISDIIDLEYFMVCDEQLRERSEEKALRQQDRTIYFSRRKEFDAIGDSRGLVRLWLAARRMHWQNTSSAAPLPGRIWRETATLTAWLVLVFGLLGGGLAAHALLVYHGETPVNVSGYLAVLVGLQIALLALLLVLILLRSAGRRWLRASLYCNLLAGLLKNLFARLLSRSQKLAGAEARLNFQSALGRIKLNRQEYGSLYFWPAFLLLQLFGCSFNIGVLATTLFKVSLADIAFGWQSTLQIDPALLARLIQYLATPWSWLVPAEFAYPSLAQIEGSRIILKDGIYHLATNNLVSWWPFLILGVFTYGLLPRLVLLLLGLIRFKTNLRSLRFDTARFRQLQQRMLSPILETQTQQRSAIPNGTPPPEVSPRPEPSEPLLANTSAGAKLLLLPDELWDQLDQSQLERQLTRHEGAGPYHKLRIGALGQSEEKLFVSIASTLHENPATGIVLLQEAWQPPLRELLALLRRIRHELPRQYPLSIVLIGKPTPENLLTRARPQDLNLWRKTLHTLADPYLSLYPLVEES